jgi:organic radical activating enzyme
LSPNFSFDPIEKFISLTWMIGARCNYDCMYCPEDLHDNTSAHPNLDQLKQIWTNFYEKTKDQNLPYRINMTGGEVTANRSFLPLVEFIKNNFDFTTNIGKIHIEGSVEQTKTFHETHEITNNISLENFNKIPFRIIKTHASYNLLLGKEQLFSNKNKLIIVTRNPLDSAVSGYYHYNNIRNYAHKKIWNTPIDRPLSFKNWALLWLKGKVSFGDWFTWTEQWNNIYLEQTEPHIHWIFYENLVSNTLEELSRLNIFLNSNLSLTELETIKNMTSFDNMKNQAKKIVYDELNSDVHFRKGTIGDWKNYFDEEILEMYKKKLETININYKLS